MDPLSLAMMIGPVIGGGLSFLGGSKNASSTQAINAANLQQQLFMAKGGYLPDLVKNAQAAGINPLAAMGQHAPTGGTAVPIGAGEGFSKAAGYFSALSPHAVEMEKLSQEKAAAEVELARSQVTNASIRNAVDKHTLGQLVSNPDKYLGPGVTEAPSKSAIGIPQSEWMSGLLSKKWNDFNLGDLYPPGPTSPIIDRGFNW